MDEASLFHLIITAWFVLAAMAFVGLLFVPAPYGRYARINYLRDFHAYQPTLARWTLLCGDFQKLELAPSDFVYADPPYDVQFRHYSREGFDFSEQERLAGWLSGHEGPVVLSNEATPRITELYRDLGYALHLLSAPRMIACNGDRRPAREILALRNLPRVRKVEGDRIVLHQR